MGKHSELWNSLPDEERQRLMPFMVETQILHIEQCKAKLIRNHQRTLKELNDQISNLKRDLPRRVNHTYQYPWPK